MRALRAPTASATSSAKSICGMCWGQFTSQASTSKTMACSGARAVATRGKARRQLGVVGNHARLAPDLHAPPVGVVHQKNEGARILRQISRRDVLPVAGEVGKGQRRLVDDVEEALGSAAVLDVGLPVLARGGEIERPRLGDEGRELRRHGRCPAAFGLHARVGCARAAALLLGFDRRREGNVGGRRHDGTLDVGRRIRREDCRGRRRCRVSQLGGGGGVDLRPVAFGLGDVGRDVFRPFRLNVAVEVQVELAVDDLPDSADRRRTSCRVPRRRRRSRRTPADTSPGRL